MLAGCAYCGVAWHRSELGRDRSGNLSCPDCKDYEGWDVVSADLKNREWGQPKPRISYPPSENYRVIDTDEVEIPIRTPEDIGV